MVFVIFLEKNGKRYYQKKRFVPRAECAGDLMPKRTQERPQSENRRKGTPKLLFKKEQTEGCTSSERSDGEAWWQEKRLRSLG